MCRQLILLAKNDHGQMIFTCEHKTMHLTHKHTTLCLTQTDFIRFAQWVVEGNLFVLNQSGDWHVQESSDGQVELWLISGGLRLTVIEFFAFTDLLRMTLHRLETFSLDDLLPVNKPAPVRPRPAKSSLN